MFRSAERTEKINRFDPKQLNSISIYLFSKYHKFLSRLQKRAADCRGEACNREILKIYCICTDVDVDTVVGWLWACVRISTWTVVKSTQSKLLPTIYITPVRCISFHCQAVVLHCLRCSGRSECNKMWTVTMWAAWSLVRLASWCGCHDHVEAPLPTLARDSGNNSHYLIRYLIWKRQLY